MEEVDMESVMVEKGARKGERVSLGKKGASTDLPERNPPKEINLRRIY